LLTKTTFMNGFNRYVILADDDNDDIVLMEEAFNRKKLPEKLVSVKNGDELIKHLYAINDKRRWPRLILLDLNMPGKNGRETLVELKAHPYLKTIPVVIYSTTNDHKEIKECYELGANSYVVKPAAFEKLLRTVEIIQAYWCQTAVVSF
jgi:CheY-like chemotaxis protein